MKSDNFVQLVAEALDDLPEEFRQQLDNVDVVVEEMPSRHQLHKLGLRHPLSLFGLYEGVPKTKRPQNYTFVKPDKISIFRIPIVARYQRESAIRRKVQAVVLHEIGHHFGMSEADLSQRPKAQ